MFKRAFSLFPREGQLSSSSSLGPLLKETIRWRHEHGPGYEEHFEDQYLRSNDFFLPKKDQAQRSKPEKDDDSDLDRNSSSCKIQ